MNGFSHFSETYHAALSTHTLGRALELHEELDSTNAYLKRRFLSGGASKGLAAVALSQTSGRGRLGRVRASAAGEGLYLSFVTPAVPGELLPLVPVAAGVAVAQACRTAAGCEAGIKWPNDIMIRDRKLAGILCEGIRGQAVCGIGVNLSQSAAFFRHAELPHATSLLLETGRVPDAGELAAAIANALEPWLNRLLSEGGAALLPVFRSLCLSIGREVRALSPRGDVCGRAVDIDGEGRLVIETETGRVAVSAGEVQLRTAQGYL